MLWFVILLWLSVFKTIPSSFQGLGPADDFCWQLYPAELNCFFIFIFLCCIIIVLYGKVTYCLNSQIKIKRLKNTLKSWSNKIPWRFHFTTFWPHTFCWSWGADSSFFCTQTVFDILDTWTDSVPLRHLDHTPLHALRVLIGLRNFFHNFCTWSHCHFQLCPKRNAPFPVPERGTFLRNGTGTLYISSGLESKVKERTFSKGFLPLLL